MEGAQMARVLVGVRDPCGRDVRIFSVKITSKTSLPIACQHAKLIYTLYRTTTATTKGNGGNLPTTTYKFYNFDIRGRHRPLRRTCNTVHSQSALAGRVACAGLCAMGLIWVSCVPLSGFPACDLLLTPSSYHVSYTYTVNAYPPRPRDRRFEATICIRSHRPAHPRYV